MKRTAFLAIAMLIAAAGVAVAGSPKQELRPTGIEPDASAHVIAVYNEQTDTTQVQINAFGLTPGESYGVLGSKVGTFDTSVVGPSGTLRRHFAVDGDATNDIWIVGRAASFGGFFVVLWNLTV